MQVAKSKHDPTPTEKLAPSYCRIATMSAAAALYVEVRDSSLQRKEEVERRSRKGLLRADVKFRNDPLLGQKMTRNRIPSRHYRKCASIQNIAILTGPLFPIGIEHLIYMKFFCYGSSYGY